MRESAVDALSFTEDMEEDEFLSDKRTRNAVVMSLVVLGESAARAMDKDPKFVHEHPEIPWREIRGIRNQIAHGYFEVNFERVWNTVQTDLPILLRQLESLINEAEGEDSGIRP
jgi:uncharacterized protein with HEPN domain